MKHLLCILFCLVGMNVRAEHFCAFSAIKENGKDEGAVNSRPVQSGYQVHHIFTHFDKTYECHGGFSLKGQEMTVAVNCHQTGSDFIVVSLNRYPNKDGIVQTSVSIITFTKPPVQMYFSMTCN